jgi:alpha-glucosidase
MWYEFPADKKTYLVSDQYMVGSDLIVAPVVKEGQRNRRVYLPAGSSWVNWWTGERLDGGKEHYLDAPLDRLLIFGRAGAMIPTQSVIQHTGEMANAEITLNIIVGIAPEKVESAVLFQDAGEGYGYRQSAWSEMRFEHRPGSIRFARSGTFAGRPVKYIEVIGLQAAPKQMFADGREIRSNYDEKTKRLKTEVPANVAEVTMVR